MSTLTTQINDDSINNSESLSTYTTLTNVPCTAPSEQVFLPVEQTLLSLSQTPSPISQPWSPLNILDTPSFEEACINSPSPVSIGLSEMESALTTWLEDDLWYDILCDTTHDAVTEHQQTTEITTNDVWYATTDNIPVENISVDNTPTITLNTTVDNNNNINTELCTPLTIHYNDNTVHTATLQHITTTSSETPNTSNTTIHTSDVAILVTDTTTRSTTPCHNEDTFVTTPIIHPFIIEDIDHNALLLQSTTTFEQKTQEPLGLLPSIAPMSSIDEYALPPRTIMRHRTAQHLPQQTNTQCTVNDNITITSISTTTLTQPTWSTTTNPITSTNTCPQFALPLQQSNINIHLPNTLAAQYATTVLPTLQLNSLTPPTQMLNPLTAVDSIPINQINAFAMQPQATNAIILGGAYTPFVQLQPQQIMPTIINVPTLVQPNIMVLPTLPNVNFQTQYMQPRQKDHTTKIIHVLQTTPTNANKTFPQLINEAITPTTHMIDDIEDCIQVLQKPTEQQYQFHNYKPQEREEHIYLEKQEAETVNAKRKRPKYYTTIKRKRIRVNINNNKTREQNLEQDALILTTLSLAQTKQKLEPALSSFYFVFAHACLHSILENLTNCIEVANQTEINHEFLLLIILDRLYLVEHTLLQDFGNKTHMIIPPTLKFNIKFTPRTTRNLVTKFTRLRMSLSNLTEYDKFLDILDILYLKFKQMYKLSLDMHQLLDMALDHIVENKDKFDKQDQIAHALTNAQPLTKGNITQFASIQQILVMIFSLLQQHDVEQTIRIHIYNKYLDHVLYMTGMMKKNEQHESVLVRQPVIRKSLIPIT